MPVDPADVTSLIDGDVATVVPIVTTMAKAYTRGQGFTGNEPHDEITAVITSAAARLAANGAQHRRKRVDDVEYEAALAPAFSWSLAELFVLNRYRKRAM
ncbi:hypothetical protein [Mycobacterium attenuatum]|uniref:hypothetical protein n=1 Tax=Mycobacterium attenuatum TaxID=2341086 RepID=UPI000F021B99|nr:hypothetical protein [Mycobacterium attenuatum]VBA62101.1 hypothetical protein LAUMK41_05488 [Mycobacterium attenuatum]